MDTMKQEEFAPIDISLALKLIWRHFLRLWWIPAVLALVLGVYSGIRSASSYRPMYETSAILSVSTSIEDGSYSYYADSAATEQVVGTFSYILNSEVMSERLRQALGGSLGGSIRAEFVNGTSLFALVASSSDPQKAVDLIDAVITLYPQVSAPILGSTQLQIIEAAPLPTEPVNTVSWSRSAFSGAAKGIMAGLAAIVLYALTRTTVTSSDDVKALVNLKCLTKIPEIVQKARKTGKRSNLLITQESNEGFREAFHLMRARLLRQLDPKDKVILFTSSIPSEGKSSIAANTALSLAREGRRVLLVDADLRHPSIKPLLGLTNKSAGLGEYLSNTSASLKLIRVGSTSLHVLAGDEAFDNPTALFQHDRLETIMQAFTSTFDYVILDTPPACMMADATALSRHADKVVYVIREDFATKNQIRYGIQAISSEAKLCGFVLNRTTQHSTGSYGYGYGYNYSKTSKQDSHQK